VPTILHHIIGLRRAVGSLAGASILVRRLLNNSSPLPVKIPAPGGGEADTIFLRPTDSDLFVAGQVFGWREYELPWKIEAELIALGRSWRAGGTVPIVVDGGANIGYSSLFFASRFPEAIVLAVEPNPESYELLLRNTSKCRNVIPVQAALWRDDDGVDLEFEEHGSWAARTVAPRNRPTTRSVTLESLIETIADARLLICKLDIEGAEREVCAASAEILQSAACVIVETHDFLFKDGGCRAAVTRTLAPTMTAPSTIGENLVFLKAPVTAGDHSRQL
jgi:FkbM family methyltransferase